MTLILAEPIGDGLWKLPGNDIFGVEWVVECSLLHDMLQGEN